MQSSNRSCCIPSVSLFRPILKRNLVHWLVHKTCLLISVVGILAVLSHLLGSKRRLAQLLPSGKLGRFGFRIADNFGAGAEIEPIYILFWIGPFGDQPEFRIDPNLCGNCVLTYDQNYLDASDAVIIHFTEARMDLVPDPRKRKSHQMFAFYSTESPFAVTTLRNLTFPDMDFYFNWTITYKRDSGIYLPFVEFNRQNGVFNGFTENEYGVEAFNGFVSFLALWMAGNCHITISAIHRKYLIFRLESLGLTIDKYGECFSQNAPRNGDYFPFAAKYKFYMAFENAEHCRDYITEKLWSNSYEAGLVPVVWGPTKADIEAIAPKGSFIYVPDYPRLSDLVKYLKFLDQNPVEYRKYFDWRLRQPTPAEYMMVEHGPKYQRDVGMCKMCRLLWEKRKYNNITSVVPSIIEFIKRNESKKCLMEGSTGRVKLL
ncbi:alpha-(1,3)-fucosyltransferase 7-like [Ciona intestinalis]